MAEFTGVWIPKHIIEDENLNVYEKQLYAEISCFEECFLSNETLAKRLSCSEQTITRYVKKLKDKRYVSQVSFDGRQRKLTSLKDKPSQKVEADQSSVTSQPSQKVDIDNSIENNIEYNSSKEEENFSNFQEPEVILCDDSGEPIKQKKPKKQPREDINYVLSGIKKIVGMLDGTIKEQRFAVKNFIDSKARELLEEAKILNPTKEQIYKTIFRTFELAKEDDFHRKHCKKIGYVYRNAGSIVVSSQKNKGFIAV